MQHDDKTTVRHDADREPVRAGDGSSSFDWQARCGALEKKLKAAQSDARELSSLRNRVLQLEIERAALLGSASWKLSAPLRQAASVVKALRLAAATLSRQVEARGGIVPAVKYYQSVLGREGMPGMVARLRRLKSGAGFADGPPRDEVYHEWIERYDSITPEKRRELLTRIERLERQPKFSIVVPVYNSDERFLREMIASVRDQIYTDWELCIADDASTDARVRDVLTEAAASDRRIKLVFRETNGHISEASNSALALATGDYVVLLDHDDIIPPHALALVALYIDRHPEGRMFYSDEDKLNEKGQRTTPYFKSDWNPQMFLTQNMFSHLGVFETALVREAGGFRRGYEGSQDYDLALRCVDIAGHDQVVHIPHVLYHWRIVPGSTAGSGSEKPYALVAAMRALEDHLERNGIDATVEHPYEALGTLRVRYGLKTHPLVSIIIPTRDGLALTKQCIDSVLGKTLYREYEIIVVDNGSVKPETLAYFDEITRTKGIRVIRDDSPFNFSALNNRAVREARGEFVCLLNNDIEVISPDWLNEMVGIAVQPGVGAVGACLWYPNDTLQHGGVLIGLGGVAGHMHHMLQRGQFGYFGRAVAMQNLWAVTAACLVVKKSVYEEVGGLNEELAVAFNDVDFCLRLVKAGYRNVWTPHAELYHHESATRGSDMDADKYQRFVGEVRWMEKEWEGWLEHDPAYNPNLSLNTNVLPFTLASPPRVGQFE
ncbi:glycosyl transferase family protein [Caballeronia fortuita]|uniref:Glycosyl transferase family protein n=1 Tax=Caballeronia fortuita TaxID=1777138 RepID=A0A158BNP4_9BURK|nr:glycosyltransferase family 2 protein [Caballeronia fortuita]SAK71699.1 glycosyl transferase family protein [Caballeronia fortuita]